MRVNFSHSTGAALLCDRVGTKHSGQRGVDVFCGVSVTVCRAVPHLISHPGSRQRVFSVSSLSLASLNLGDSDSVHSEKRSPR